MNRLVLLTVICITFYGFTTCQFSPLSPPDVYYNHPYSTAFAQGLGCNIESWYSVYHQKNIFMISYFDMVPGQVSLLKSDLLSFSMNYSYYLQTSFSIGDTYPNNIQDDGHLLDVVLSSSSIMVLSQVLSRFVYGDNYKDNYLFYRIISNYQQNTSDIHVSPMKVLKLPFSDCSIQHAQATATKLYGSDLFIIVYANDNDLLRYFVNETTANALSLTPDSFIGRIDIYHTPTITGIKVRASKTHPMYLVIWSAEYKHYFYGLHWNYTQ
eukprot:553526_1